MNVNDAMETAAAYLAAHEQEQEPLFDSEEVAITLANEVGRLRAELAEAKAASVCPVKIHGCFYSVAFDHFGLSSEDSRRFDDWLRDRVEERVDQ